ncbi:putative transposable element [Trichonephila clavipes]|nr:putative transposable element [Trichonephila clavipes]
MAGVEPATLGTEGQRQTNYATQSADDEAYFWLNGYVNKQNCHIWSEANPQVYGETPLHPEKLTVWCALWAGGIIGPYFFKNDEGHNVTVNELWFQQDGATCHTARATIDLLKDTLGDRLISRFGPVNWPPRSCDLTPLDYFLWGYVKSLVYADKPQTLDYLEDNIRRVIADIRPQMLEKVIENWTSRLDYIRDSRGSHMPEIIFKINKQNNNPTPYIDRKIARCVPVEQWIARWTSNPKVVEAKLWLLAPDLVLLTRTTPDLAPNSQISTGQREGFEFRQIYHESDQLHCGSLVTPELNLQIEKKAPPSMSSRT